MTKSVKEKDRLAKIRECQFNDIPVPTELIKVKFIEPPHVIKLYKEYKQLKRYNFFIGNFKKHFKKRINYFVTDIANQMDIYDLKVKVVPNVLDFGTSACYYLLLFLSDTKGKTLGQLEILPDKYSLKNNDCNEYSFLSYIFHDDLKIKNLKLRESMINLSCKMRFDDSCIYKKFSKCKHKQFYKNMIDFIAKKNKFMNDTQTNESASLSFEISKNISCRLKKNKRDYEITDISGINEIDILKAFIGIDCVKITIPEEDLIMGNIEEIKNMIRLSNY